MTREQAQELWRALPEGLQGGTGKLNDLAMTDEQKADSFSVWACFTPSQTAYFHDYATTKRWLAYLAEACKRHA